LTGLYSEGINERLAHEVAHAWWGHVAKRSDLEDQWLSEATAEYYAAVAIGNLRRERDFKNMLQKWRARTKASDDKGSVYMGNYTVSMGETNHRSNLLYGKGPLVLHGLRLEMHNDDLFFTVLKSYVSSFSMKPVWTKDFVGITNYITERDWTPWFDKYLFGTEIPRTK